MKQKLPGNIPNDKESNGKPDNETRVARILLQSQEDGKKDEDVGDMLANRHGSKDQRSVRIWSEVCLKFVSVLGHSFAKRRTVLAERC